MSNIDNSKNSIRIFDDIILYKNDVKNFDKKLREQTVFLFDIGMDVIACQSANKGKDGYIVLVYDAYTKNIFELLEIPFEEKELEDEFVIVYSFNNASIMEEHIQRIHDLYRKYT